MDHISRAFEWIGVAVIVGAFALTLVFALRDLSRDRGTAEIYERVRRVFGRGLLLGLEVLVAADLIRTVAVEPTLRNVEVLGILVLIRTLLSFSLDVEIDGVLPWRKRRPRDATAVEVVSGAHDAHRVAFLDWLACAAGGRDARAARAARAAGDGLLENIAALGAAGHVLDFDDTYLPGIAHLSAATAPAALALGAARGATVGAVLDAYAAGFEQTAALARASHPALYERGWHPTAVCGAVGAATAAARLLGLARRCARQRARARCAARRGPARRVRLGRQGARRRARRGRRRPRGAAGRRRCAHAASPPSRARPASLR